MVAGVALGEIGRWLKSHFLLNTKATEEICQGWNDEIVALPAFLIHLERLQLSLKAASGN
jgi:hypothetical protein